MERIARIADGARAGSAVVQGRSHANGTDHTQDTGNVDGNASDEKDTCDSPGHVASSADDAKAEGAVILDPSRTSDADHIEFAPRPSAQCDQTPPPAALPS